MNHIFSWRFLNFDLRNGIGYFTLCYGNWTFISLNKIFENIDKFCKWLISREHKNYTALAHNTKGYDSYFILKYCVENSLKPYTIYNGAKLMLLEIPQINLKIIDSTNFVAQALSTFPKTFGLTEMKKGYFPHYFNKKCNQNYDGPIPVRSILGTTR